MSVPMQALKRFSYAGRRLVSGDRFNARGETDARLLAAVGNATRHVQVPKAITDPEPSAAIAPKRGRGYRKQALVAQPASEATQDSPQPGASEAQASEEGTGDTPGAGSAETPTAADEAAPPAARRRYTRRDLQGAPE